MEILENVPLAPYTTFKIGGPARYFCTVENEDDIKSALAFAQEKGVGIFPLGGGSNMLISDNGINALVVHVANKGIEVVQDNAQDVMLKISSGEVWDEVVAYSCLNGWWGIENLSHIPGRMGAFAVQNVGAYGQEARDVVISVQAFNISGGYVQEIKNSECAFSYRSSIFNGQEKGNYIILSTYIRLSKQPKPNLNYKDLKEKFPTGQADLQSIRSAVIGIRNLKFPFPTEPKNGNAGSFFKNLIMSGQEYSLLEQNISQAFNATAVEALRTRKISLGEEKVKIPTAFLLDLCGLKGVTHENVKINPSQPLVILNASGNAKAKEVLDFVKFIKSEILTRIGIRLSIEPELVGFSPEELAQIDV